MNLIEKILWFLQGTMERPNPYGWFHLLWIGIIVVMVLFLCKGRGKRSSKELKLVLGIYGIIALLLEIIKQLIWSFNYDPLNNLIYWDYQWYAFPFQLCTTPIFVSLICLWLDDSKLRQSLLSYMAFVTILGSFMTVLLPDSCFVETIEVNIHTMWLHCGSLVVSIYLLISGEVELTMKNFIRAILVFLMMVTLALGLNIIIYNLPILNGEEFNMFYISPYFISSLPVFDVLQESLPYLLYLLTYICVMIVGAGIVYGITFMLKRCLKK